MPISPSSLSVKYCRDTVADMAGIKKKLVEIDIIADTVCPWCFVGKRNLDKALVEGNDRYEFELRWHPFRIDPEVPKEGIYKKEFYDTKMGADVAEVFETRMADVCNIYIKYFPIPVSLSPSFYLSPHLIGDMRREIERWGNETGIGKFFSLIWLLVLSGIHSYVSFSQFADLFKP